MNGLSQNLAPTFLAVAMFLTGTAQALEIQQFDRMTAENRSEYVRLLVRGAEKILTDEGRADLAAQVDYLFTTKDAGDNQTIGMVEFELSLAQLRADDAAGVFENPNVRRLEVEEVMYETLEKNGIVLPTSFLTVGKDFKPKIQSQKK